VNSYVHVFQLEIRPEPPYWYSEGGPASLLIGRVCRGFLLPGHMPLGLRGYRSLLCVVTQSYAVLYGQNQTTGRAHGSRDGRSIMPLAARSTMQRQAWYRHVVNSQLITCLQSMAKLSSSVYGLARSVPSVHLSAATSRSVGVGCGCHRGPVKSTCSLAKATWRSARGFLLSDRASTALGLGDACISAGRRPWIISLVSGPVHPCTIGSDGAYQLPIVGISQANTRILEEGEENGPLCGAKIVAAKRAALD
jgi:hypothetical protein